MNRPELATRRKAHRPLEASQVLDRAAKALIELQNEDGHWVGELEGDTILSSEYVLTHYFLGWHRDDDLEIRHCLNFLRRQQNDEGGWSQYPGGPSDVSCSAKAYFALKLFGDPIDAPHMTAARNKIRRLGGLNACNTFTKIYLALFGQVQWSECPAVPPELILFPRWFPFNIYEMSSWSRTIVIPLSVIWAHKPRCEVPKEANLDDIRVPLDSAPEYRVVTVDGTSRTWQLIFTSLDKAAKLADGLNGRFRVRPLRRLALKKAVEWMTERFENSDGLGAIFPPTINSLIAFRALGYPDDDPHVQAARRSLKGLRTRAGVEEIRIQPCHSPVWDTAIAVNALALAKGDYVNEPVRRGVRWLLDREVKSHGDWAVKVKGVEPAGWYFEYANEYYPDIDDTIMVMMALRRGGASEDEPAIGRAMKWVRAMQCREGGWAAFDRDNNKWVLTNVPFADHNAMLDPPTADITARTLEMMGMFGIGLNDPQVPAAMEFVRRDQTAEGAWFGRWGVNYIYGTWQVLRGLAEIGENMDAPYVQKAARWLESIQNDDGGFGETIASYEDPSLKGQGPSTPSQTAWVIMGLIAAGHADGPTVERAIQYLIETQLPDGTWEEELWTGTGFPKVFYLRYHLYRLYFPIMALAMWCDATGREMPPADQSGWREQGV